MIAKILTSLFIVFWIWFQDGNLQRQVMRKHPNGKPYVIMYFKATTQELAKEEVYFPNGSVQWTGTYKNDVENGTWKYYWENGKLKSEQNYINGKEDGISIEYDEKGKKLKETIYSKGKLISEKKF
jgi:antitoxin component YwqK of YwqJK toxin-antitoxin module